MDTVSDKGFVNDEDVLVSTALTTPCESLAAVELNLPACMLSLLQVDYDVSASNPSLPAWRRLKHPSAATDVYVVPVISARVLTSENAVKKTLEISLDVTKTDNAPDVSNFNFFRADLKSQGNTDIEFEPGDSFGVMCVNDTEEVDAILFRLGLSSRRDTPCKVYWKDSKVAVNLPKHIASAFTSLFALFVNCCDIRAVPKKSLLRILSEHTVDAAQRRRLRELSSRQGSSDYLNFVVAPKVSLLDLLKSFPSCLPPVECLLEHLPALQPRVYSVINSPLVDANCLQFLFNLVEIPAKNGRTYDRGGICTKWMDNLTRPIQKRREIDEDDDHRLSEGVHRLSLVTLSIPVFMRKFKNFRLPKDHAKPLILIGPGTGVAPFIGFLEHRSMLMNAGAESANKTFGKVLLFYGCRHKDRDFLYKDRLEAFQRDGVLSELFVCFSRDKLDSTGDRPPPRYVQHCVRRHGADVFRLIHDEQAVVFVCGDAKNMANDVYETIVAVVQMHGELEESVANKYVSAMQTSNRYLQDIWT